MKRIVSVLAAAFAALTVSTAAGAAPLYDAEPYQPFSVLIESNSVDENTESVALAEYSGIEKLYLEDNVALIDEPSTEVTEEPKTYTAQDILKMAGISLAVGIVIALIVCLINLHENRKTEAHSQRLHKEEQLSYNTLQGYFHICGAEQKETR